MNRTRENEIQEACNNCTVRWINRYLNPRKDVDRVEGCVIMAAVFMIVLAIGTPRRRQSRSIIIRYGTDGMFVLSFPLICYTLGLMQGEVIRMELYPVWALFLAMLFGGTNAMTVQKLDENKQSMRLYCDYLLLMFYIGTVLSMFHTAREKLPYIRYVVMAVSILLSLKNAEQWLAAGIASKPSSENGIKWLASYMKREHQLSTYYDPCTMQGYKYVVLIHAGSGGSGESPITLEKIWSDNIGVLSISSSLHIRHLKDLCMSFSLFHLVVRRYFGYTCAESKLDKTRDLVLHGLLRTEQDYERAFQVIEEELAFVHDFFFTKYAYIMYGNEVQTCALSLAFTSVSIGVGIWALSALNPHHSILKDRLVETSTKDVLVTKIAFVALSISQLLQIWSYCVSDWAKVSLVCKYATNPAWQGNASIEKLLLLLGRSGRWLRSWSNTIDQYSVLDPSSSRYWDRLKHLFQSGKAGKPVKLSTEVKTAVARTVKDSISGRLSSGVFTLIRYGMKDQLCWACLIDDEFTPTHSILLWHIATSYCTISEMVRYPDENFEHSNQAVATSLSRYCAYLVAFAPALLPGSPAETKCTLDELVEEVTGVLQNLASPREKYEKLRELNNVLADSRQSRAAQLLTKAVVLGKALETKNRTIRWNLLADFWAEMLVYIAPSDNIAGHIEPLAQGGEFVTHVWALLMHAGILERPATVP